MRLRGPAAAPQIVAAKAAKRATVPRVNTTLTPLELDVLKAVLRDDVPSGATLRAQIPFLTVASRHRTERGFHTELAASADAPRATLDRGHLGDVVALVEDVPSGIGFVAYVKGGYLKLLEAYTFGDEPMPTDVATYELTRVVRG